MNVSAKTLMRQYATPQASELNAVWGYRKTHDTLSAICRRLAIDDMGCEMGYALVVQWARTCGYELHESFNPNTISGPLLDGHQKIHRWEDIVNCALNFIVNNHTEMGDDLGVFLNELCNVAHYLADNFNDHCHIDQVEPHIFRVMTDDDKPIQLFTWKQSNDGYAITRVRK